MIAINSGEGCESSKTVDVNVLFSSSKDKRKRDKEKDNNKKKFKGKSVDGNEDDQEKAKVTWSDKSTDQLVQCIWNELVTEGGKKLLDNGLRKVS